MAPWNCSSCREAEAGSIPSWKLWGRSTPHPDSLSWMCISWQELSSGCSPSPQGRLQLAAASHKPSLPAQLCSYPVSLTVPPSPPSPLLVANSECPLLAILQLSPFSPSKPHSKSLEDLEQPAGSLMFTTKSHFVLFKGTSNTRPSLVCTGQAAQCLHALQQPAATFTRSIFAAFAKALRNSTQADGGAHPHWRTPRLTAQFWHNLGVLFLLVFF